MLFSETGILGKRHRGKGNADAFPKIPTLCHQFGEIYEPTYVPCRAYCTNTEGKRCTFTTIEPLAKVEPVAKSGATPYKRDLCGDLYGAGW